MLERGPGLNLGSEMQRRVFDRFGMTDSSMIWRREFAANLADGWNANGAIETHDERSKVRASGSLDTTIAEFAKFAAVYLRGEGLTEASRREIVRGKLPITTATQFPSFQPELPSEKRRPDLKAALGVIAFTGPQGAGWYKGGHNDTTGNIWVCIARGLRCVVLLANDVRAQAAFPRLVRLALRETGVPFDWRAEDAALGLIRTVAGDASGGARQLNRLLVIGGFYCRYFRHGLRSRPGIRIDQTGDQHDETDPEITGDGQLRSENESDRERKPQPKGVEPEIFSERGANPEKVILVWRVGGLRTGHWLAPSR